MKVERITVGLRVTKENHDRMKVLAKKLHWSLNKVAEISVIRYLDSRKIKVAVSEKSKT